MEQNEKNMQLNKLAERLKENTYSLSINRIPIQTKREFIDFANKEFCGDYGMTLHYIWDQFRENIKVEFLLDEINEIKSRLEVLEQPKKEIKTLDGTTIKGKGGIENEQTE